MIKLIKYILLLTIFLSLILIFTPLSLYYDFIKREIKPIQLHDISGSIIKGSSEKLSYMGINLGRSNWLTYPNSWNSLAVDLKIESDQYDFSSRINTKSDMTQLKNLTGTVDWGVIKKYINFNRGEISGYLKLDFEEVSIKSGIPYQIKGTIKTKDFKLIKPLIKELGEIIVEFNSDNPSIIVGTVNSDSNVMNVSGAIYIHNNHRWEVKLNILPMPGEYELEYALQGIGDRRSGGGRSLNLAGFY